MAGAKVYVVINAFLQDEDLHELPSFLALLQSLKVDGVIVSDLGVLTLVAQHTNLPIHLSTQASCLNGEAAKWYGKLGVKRIILGREVSIADAGKIKRESGLEVEMFIHGSMCSAYSGNCVISNYTRGRDANRGGCAHSCRVEYELKDQSNPTVKDYFMSAKDLMGIDLIEEFARAKIDSVKIEGRNKGAYYAGVTTKVYAEALNNFRKRGHIEIGQRAMLKEELAKLSHRDYSQGGLVDPSFGGDSIHHRRLHQESDYAIAGLVLEVLPKNQLLVQAKGGFSIPAELELIPFKGRPLKLATDLTTLTGESCHRIRPGMLFKIPSVPLAQRDNIVRVKLALNLVNKSAIS